MYLKTYKRCYWCGAGASDLAPIRESDVLVSNSSLAEVITPELPAFLDLQLNYEQKFEIWAASLDATTRACRGIQSR